MAQETRRLDRVGRVVSRVPRCEGPGAPSRVGFVVSHPCATAQCKDRARGSGGWEGRRARKLFEVLREIDIDLAAGERDFDDCAGCVPEQRAGARVSAKAQELRKYFAREDGRCADRSLVSGRRDHQPGLRRERVEKCEEMACRQERLIAGQEKHTVGDRGSLLNGAQAGANGSGDSISPCAVDDCNCVS
jgi:hypothetical protein